MRDSSSSRYEERAQYIRPTVCPYRRLTSISKILDLPWTDFDKQVVDHTKPIDPRELEAVGAKQLVENFKVSTYGSNHEAEALEDETAPKAKKVKTIGGGLGADGAIDFVGLAKNDELERCTAAVLKTYCKRHDLKTTGVKSVLADRVMEHVLM